MTEEFELPSRARTIDLVRPQRLFAGLAVHPSFVAATLLFVLCVVVYTWTALGPALPRVVPALLAMSQWTESELERALRTFFLVLSFALPILFLLIASTISWLLLAVTRERQPFMHVLSLLAHVSLWAGLGFLTKALLVKLTGHPEPPVNLAFFVKNLGDTGRILLAFTNPFLLLALLWTAKGLRAWGARPSAAIIGGALPWAAWIAFLAAAGGGTGTRFAPSAPVSYEGWETIEKKAVTLRHPPDLAGDAGELATILDGFTLRLADQFEFEPRPVRIHAYPDHETLERATGEFLHVRVTGSVRGRDLLFLEMPGRSAAMTREAGLRDAIRYAAIMQLAPIGAGAPRWFVEGVAHAAAIPYSPALERQYVEVVKKTGVPSIDLLFDEQLFRTPDGPVLARSLVDFIAYRHGRDTPAAILRDVSGGGSFRDALFERTRFTTTGLESGWQDHIRATLEHAEPPGAGAPPDSAQAEDVAPFRPRH